MSEFGALNLEEMTGENNRLAEQGGAVGFLDQFVPMPEVKPGQTGRMVEKSIVQDQLLMGNGIAMLLVQFATITVGYGVKLTN